MYKFKQDCVLKNVYLVIFDRLATSHKNTKNINPVTYNSS